MFFSQFHIGQYILKNIAGKGASPVVVSELHALNSDVDPIFKEGVCEQVKKYFPYGLNMVYDQLTPTQGELLWYYGAGIILFALKV